jgi:hypothetical protein
MMALLGPLTVKTDERTSLWSIWSTDSLIRDELPITQSASAGIPTITMTAGNAGARILGLAFSDENPVFEDSNHNAVPDDFERTELGQLLPSDAGAGFKADLRLAWSAERRRRPPTQSAIAIPNPDFVPDLCGSEGAPLHGMPNSLRYRSEASK